MIASSEMVLEHERPCSISIPAVIQEMLGGDCRESQSGGCMGPSATSLDTLQSGGWVGSVLDICNIS